MDRVVAQKPVVVPVDLSDGSAILNPMDPTKQILAWAESLAADLTLDLDWRSTEFGGFWASSPANKGTIRARATAALDFLERFAGSDSQWTKSAHAVFMNKGENQSMESGARAVGEVITEWVRQVRSGQLRPRAIESLELRTVASVDLMEQVRILNADASVIPAAPIVLAGAALEVALRSAVEELGLEPPGRPSIDSYAKALRTADVLGKQDMKDVEQMAGLRNAAAHGDHESLSRERAGLMEQQVNLFLPRLQALLSTDGAELRETAE